MRWQATVLLALSLISCRLAAQPVDPRAVKPQVVINVRKHPVGADMLEITLAEKDYPLGLLSKQAEALAAMLHSDARGLSVSYFGYDPKFKFAKATFATDGIINREAGTVNLEAIVKAMTGTPPPYTTNSFIITLENEVPVDQQTLRTYSSDAVDVVADIHRAWKRLAVSFLLFYLLRFRFLLLFLLLFI